MTRFGVMKHLRVLEDAGLVVTRRSGREKLHFLNPVPIRLIHDRWIDKYTERQVSALVDLKHELEERRHDGSTETSVDDPGLPRLHQGHAAGDLGRDHEARVDREVRLRRTGRVRPRPPARRRLPSTRRARRCARWAHPDVAIDGEVIEVDPPHKLVQTWRMLMDEAMAAEGFTRLTYEIVEGTGGRHQAHGDPRARGRAEARRCCCPAAWRTGRRRRLELGAQRPQVAARDRQGSGLAEPAQPGLRTRRREPARAGPPAVDPHPNEEANTRWRSAPS